LVQEKLSKSLQENIIVLLVFDEKALPLLCNCLDPNLFESFIYSDIVAKSIQFFQEYKRPVAEHLPDLLEDVLEGKERGKVELYRETLEHIYGNKDTINRDYTLAQLHKFIRQQKLKIGIIQAAELLEKGELDRAELVLDQSKKDQLAIFDPGTKLSDTIKFLRFFDNQENYFFTGIRQLDEIGICPAPKELFTFVSLSNRGKTWFLIHLAKYALLQRKRVLHISLEMAEEKICQRYSQNLFNISKRDELFKIPIFQRDELNRFSDLSFERLRASHSFLDTKIRKTVEEKINKLRMTKLIVKDFPTSSLTMTQLKAFLENLISAEKFSPDLILLDEPDLMKINPNNKRIDIGERFKELRGLAGEYNLAMAVVAQINRAGVGVKWLDSKYLAEDFTKFHTSDNLVSYNQSNMEYEKNLARLLVVKGRGDRKGDKILITQNYGCGQFCLDSVRMSPNYWNILKEENEN
jgi:hypothetical protein